MATLTIRTDQDVERALSALTQDGTSRSDATRAAILKAERALRRARLRAEAEELRTAAMTGAKRFAGRSAFKTWMFAILRNKIVDHIRASAREIPAASLVGERELDEPRAEAPPLQVGRDHEPSELGLRAVDPQPDASDEPRPGPDPERCHGRILQFVAQLIEGLGQRRQREVVVQDRLGHVGGPLQGQDLARIVGPQRDHITTDPGLGSWEVAGRGAHLHTLRHPGGPTRTRHTLGTTSLPDDG